MIGLGALAVIGPWIYWLATVRHNTQVGLLDALAESSPASPRRPSSMRRMPDALAGPFVEVATVFTRSRAVGVIATAGAIVVSAVILVGWIRSLTNPRRRLAGLVGLVTLPLLLVWPFTEAGRFLIPMVPFLLVGAVEGLGLFLRRAAHPWGRVGRGGERKGPRRISALLVLLIAIPYPLYALLTHRAESHAPIPRRLRRRRAWIAREGRRDGPVLTRHPGEVFWQTGRLAVLPATDDLDGLVRQIRDQKIAYVLVDADRFAHARPDAAVPTRRRAAGGGPPGIRRAGRGRRGGRESVGVVSGRGRARGRVPLCRASSHDSRKGRPTP